MHSKTGLSRGFGAKDQLFKSRAYERCSFDSGFSDMTDFGKLAKKIHGGVSATTQQARETPPEIIIVRRGNRKGLLGSLGVVRVFVGMLNDRVIYVTVNGQLVGQLDENETLKVNGCEGVNRIGVGPANKIAVEIDIELENGMKKRVYCGRWEGRIQLREDGFG